MSCLSNVTKKFKMKIICITLLFASSTFARTAVKQGRANIIGPKCPIDDPLNEDGPKAINVTAHPLAELIEGSQITNFVANGLSSLHYNFNFSCIYLTIPFEITIGHADLYFNFSADGYLDARPFRSETFPSGNFTGSGLGKISTDNLLVKGRAALRGNTDNCGFYVANLTMETINFSALTIDLGENITFGGEKANWEDISRNLKANFDQDWSDNIDGITENIRLASSSIAEKYTLMDLLEFFNGCYVDDGRPDCPSNNKYVR